MPFKRSTPVLAIAVDLGGTWVRAMVISDGRMRRRVRVPVSRVPELSSFLLKLVRGAPGPLPRAGATPARCRALVVASRGVWTARERSALRRRLAGVAERIAILSDVEAAWLGALGGRPGVLILSGTGSIVLGRDARERTVRAGGLGPLVGDEGSAFWLGREWLRWRARDGETLAVRCLVHAPDAARRIAALAPRVLRLAREGDARARRIVRDSQRELAALGARVARQLHLPSPLTVSWGGRVMDDESYRRGVARALARAGVQARWVAPAMSAADAVARLASELASSPGPWLGGGARVPTARRVTTAEATRR